MFRKIRGLNSVTVQHTREVPGCEKSVWGMTMLSLGQTLGLLTKRSVTNLVFFLFFFFFESADLISRMVLDVRGCGGEPDKL